MKKNGISKGKWILVLTAACSVILASSDDARAIGYPLPPVNLASGDQHELGQVLPGTLADNADREQYVNFMIGLSLGSSGHVIINEEDNLITRSNNNFGALPGDVTVSLIGTSMMINLGKQATYDYLLANYNGPNGGAEVWYVGDLSRSIIIAPNLGQSSLSGWALFTGGPQSVPDGGATVMLLGAALIALSVMRRCLLRN
jgi:hypothetical protein